MEGLIDPSHDFHPQHLAFDALSRAFTLSTQDISRLSRDSPFLDLAVEAKLLRAGSDRVRNRFLEAQRRAIMMVRDHRLCHNHGSSCLAVKAFLHELTELMPMRCSHATPGSADAMQLPS